LNQGGAVKEANDVRERNEEKRREEEKRPQECANNYSGNGKDGAKWKPRIISNSAPPTNLVVGCT
jgi:hypothetical protein